MLPTAGNEADEMESQRHGRGSDKESGTGKDEGREGTARDERGRKKANYQEG